MAIVATLITIGANSFTHLKEYSLGYNKLWKESDRNMNGDVRAALIGVFPKITAKTNKLNPTQVASLCASLDQPYFSVTFYDPATNSEKTANYYASDYSIKLEDRGTERFGEVDFSLVPVSKRA